MWKRTFVHYPNLSSLPSAWKMLYWKAPCKSLRRFTPPKLWMAKWCRRPAKPKHWSVDLLWCSRPPGATAVASFYFEVGGCWRRGLGWFITQLNKAVCLKAVICCTCAIIVRNSPESQHWELSSGDVSVFRKHFSNWLDWCIMLNPWFG